MTNIEIIAANLVLNWRTIKKDASKGNKQAVDLIQFCLTWKKLNLSKDLLIKYWNDYKKTKEEDSLILV